jgi:hypothetical protein
MGKWIKSDVIGFPDIELSCFLKGAFDSVVSFDDGSYGVIDFKTSQPSRTHIPFYGRQLAAYAYALEHPAAGALGLSPVTRLGLLYLDPVDINHGADHRHIVYGGEVTWQEIPKDETVFLEFLREVLSLLSLPEPPEAASGCPYCAYREDARHHGL